MEYDSVKLPDMELWDASVIAKQQPHIDFKFKDILENGDVRDQWLKNMYKYGVTFVRVSNHQLITLISMQEFQHV